MANNFLSLFIYSAILVVYCYLLQHFFVIGRDVNTSNVHGNLKTFEVFQKYQLCYFTCWNFIIQVYFIVIVILEDITIIVGFNHKITKFLNGLRSYIFTVILFPSTLLVAATFWPVFLYNRELILPEVIDIIFPNWMNHLMHTAILFPLIIELFLAKNRRIQFKSAIKGITIFILIYFIVFLSIYYTANVWLYPMFGVMSWSQRGALFLFFYVELIFFTRLAIYLQNRLRYKSVRNIKSD